MSLMENNEEYYTTAAASFNNNSNENSYYNFEYYYDALSTSTSSLFSFLLKDSILRILPNFSSTNSDSGEQIKEEEEESYHQKVAMLIAFWFIVALIIAVAINIYLKINRRTKLILDENNNECKLDDQHDKTKINNYVQSEQISTTKSTRPTTSYDPQSSKKINEFCSQPIRGSDEQSVDWINSVLQWIYDKSSNEPKFVDEIIKYWLNTLNEKSKKLVFENEVFVEFLSLEQAAKPKLSQINVAEEINENIITSMKATCDRLLMQVRVAPDSISDENRSSIYDICLNKLQSLLKMVCITNESLFVIRPLERPETKALIDGPILGSKNKFSPDVIINAVLNILTSTIYDLNFGKYPDFPHANGVGQTNEQKNKLSSNNSAKSNLERKLLVKVIKAYDLDLKDAAASAGTHNYEPHLYCTAEVDEPFQSFKTAVVRNNVETPVWEEHFMFNLNERSSEILVELFNKQNNKKDGPSNDIILGNAIVNVSDLISKPSQVQNLRLQSGLNKKDFGYLVVEFLLMEHNTSASLPSPLTNEEVIAMAKGSNQLRNISNTNNNSSQHRHNDQDYKSSVWPTTTANVDPECPTLNGSINLSLDDYFEYEKFSSFVDSFDTWSSGWERRSKSSSFLNALETDDIPNIENMLMNNICKQANNNFQFDHHNHHGAKCANQNGKYEDIQDLSLIEENGHGFEQIDRQPSINNEFPDKTMSLDKRLSDSTPRSKSLFRNIKKRFSFNKRSKSVDRQINALNRQSTVDYTTDSEWNDELNRARSVPGSREPSMPKENINNGTRSKQESFGNLSQTSTRTFLHEDSVLIMECIEKGIKRHYVVPNESAKKSKWRRRKGTKLHLFKDHLFVACHVPSSKLCYICGKKFSLRFGKQAYQCRECGLQCHKLCHVKVETRCFKSSIASLNLELAEDGIIGGEDLSFNNAQIKRSTLNATIPELKVTDAE